MYERLERHAGAALFQRGHERYTRAHTRAHSRSPLRTHAQMSHKYLRTHVRDCKYRRPAARRERACEGESDLDVVCSAMEGEDLEVDSHQRAPGRTSILRGYVHNSNSSTRTPKEGTLRTRYDITMYYENDYFCCGVTKMGKPL